MEKQLGKLFLSLAKNYISSEPRRMFDALLAEYIFTKINKITISTKQLIEITGLSRPAVQRARKKLLEMKLIRCIPWGIHPPLKTYEIQLDTTKWKLKKKKYIAKQLYNKGVYPTVYTSPKSLGINESSDKCIPHGIHLQNKKKQHPQKHPSALEPQGITDNKKVPKNRFLLRSLLQLRPAELTKVLVILLYKTCNKKMYLERYEEERTKFSGAFFWEKELCKEFLKNIIKRNGNALTFNERSIEAQFKYMIRIKKRDPDIIKALIPFALSTSWRRVNITTPRNIEHYYDSLIVEKADWDAKKAKKLPDVGTHKNFSEVPPWNTDMKINCIKSYYKILGVKVKYKIIEKEVLEELEKQTEETQKYPAEFIFNFIEEKYKYA